jgi:2-keto-3-deoxy-L-fuconate dehydrogenase
MPDSLKGKVALITAAARGIGRAITEAFISADATVLATDCDAEALAGLSCRAARLDVRDRDAIHSLVSSESRIDVLVNCAGYVHHGTLLDVDDQAWWQSFDLNVRSMFLTMQAVVPKMRDYGGGSIINISSVVSTLKAAPQRFVYAATKAAVIGMTKAVATDFIGKGIRANAICPGTIDTPSLRERIRANSDPKQALASFLARQPCGRLGRVEEIAQLAVYLASDAGAFATGTTFVIDGGMSL